MTTRHNKQVQLLADDLMMAARNLVVEPKQCEYHSTPADIRATGKAVDLTGIKAHARKYSSSATQWAAC
eukprot:IDg20222t1